MTDQEKNDILNNVQRQYIGARYVPKFFHGPDGTPTWVGNVPYEALTVVTYLGNSYTSKVPVPEGIGNPSQNPTYWALTGNYNAQVEEYRVLTESVSENTKTLLKQVQFSTPEQFYEGDWTAAIEMAINSGKPVLMTGSYKISRTINVPIGVTILGLNSHITSEDFGPSNWKKNSLGDNLSDNKRFVFVLEGENLLTGLHFNTQAACIRIIGNHVTIKNCYLSTFSSNKTGIDAYYAIDIKGANDINIDNVEINMPPSGWRDGIHVNGLCSNITISNCDIISGDDPIALNSCEEVPGPIKNVVINNCILRGFGVRFYSKNAETEISDVCLNNCIIYSITMDGNKSSPIRFVNGWGQENPDTYNSVYKRILIDNVITHSENEKYEHLYLTDCSIDSLQVTNCDIKNFKVSKNCQCIMYIANSVIKGNSYISTGTNLTVTGSLVGDLYTGTDNNVILNGCVIHQINSAEISSGAFFKISDCSFTAEKQNLLGDNEYILTGCRMGSTESPIKNGAGIFFVSNCSGYTYNLLTDSNIAKRITGDVKLWGEAGFPTSPFIGDIVTITNNNSPGLYIYYNNAWHKLQIVS